MHFQVHHIIAFTYFHFPNVSFYELFDSLNCLIWKLRSLLYSGTLGNFLTVFFFFFFFLNFGCNKIRLMRSCYDQLSPDTGNILLSFKEFPSLKLPLFLVPHFV